MVKAREIFMSSKQNLGYFLRILSRGISDSLEESESEYGWRIRFMVGKSEVSPV